MKKSAEKTEQMIQPQPMVKPSQDASQAQGHQSKLSHQPQFVPLDGDDILHGHSPGSTAVCRAVVQRRQNIPAGQPLLTRDARSPRNEALELMNLLSDGGGRRTRASRLGAGRASRVLDQIRCRFGTTGLHFSISRHVREGRIEGCSQLRTQCCEKYFLSLILSQFSHFSRISKHQLGEQEGDK